MLKRLMQRLILLCATLASTHTLHAANSYDPALTWQTLHSQHFNVHFHDGEQALAAEAARVAEDVHARLTAYFSWTPARATDIVLNDRVDMTNGAATPLPQNTIILYLMPPDESALADYADWLDLLITHEYTHIIHLDKASGKIRFLRAAFGRFPFFFPNRFQPTWLIEGLATYQETDVARGIGRGQSSYFDMVMRMEVESGIKPLKQVNQIFSSWPGPSAAYLYGVNFYTFLHDKYGDEKIKALIETYSSNLLPYSVNGTTRDVFHTRMHTLWREFEQYLRDKHSPTILAIKQQGIIAGDALSNNGYFKSNLHTQNDDIYYIANDGFSNAALMHIAPNATAPERLVNVNPGADFDIHPQGGVMVTQLELSHNTNLLYDLYRFDSATRSVTRLTHGARYRTIAWRPDGLALAAIHYELGLQRLDLISPQGILLETLWRANEKENVGQISWAPDGRHLVASLFTPENGWDLHEFDLADRSWRKLTSSSALEIQPHYTRDGLAILFSADDNGIFNVYKLDLATGNITTLTNVLGGAFNPAQNSVGDIVYTGYSAKGFDIFKLNSNALPILPAPTRTSGPSAIQREFRPLAENVSITAYQPLASMSPKLWLPYYYATANQNEWGLTTYGSDALFRHAYQSIVAYDVTNNLVIGDIDYVYDRWYPQIHTYAGRINRIRIGENNDKQMRHIDNVQFDITQPFSRINQQLLVGLSAATTQQSYTPLTSNTTALATRSDTTAGVGFAFDSTKAFPFSISRTDGRSVSFTAEASDMALSNYQGQTLKLDWREFVRVKQNSVFAARFVGGFGFDHPRPFHLGAALPDDNSGAVIPFNQREFGLRGFLPNLAELEGRRMLLGSLELRLPLGLIERGIMAPPIALDRLSSSVFVDSGNAWDDGVKPARLHSAAGVEATLRTILFYSIPINLRLVVAFPLDRYGTRGGSISAGSSF